MNYDNRFAADHRLIFLLFNQQNRQRVVRSVAAKCITDNSQFNEFLKMVNDESFGRDLLNASLNIGSKESKELLRKIGKMLNIFGGDVPYSSTERGKTLSVLYAYVYHFGMPSFFITLSPPDQDNAIFMNIMNSNGCGGFDKLSFKVFEDFTKLERLKKIVKYPGLSAKFFHYLVECVLEFLFCIESSNKNKKTVPLYSPNKSKG